MLPILVKLSRWKPKREKKCNTEKFWATHNTYTYFSIQNTMVECWTTKQFNQL